VDRKYGHRGYRDAEKQDKKDKSHETASRPLAGPRGADQIRPRTPRMVGTVTRARCANLRRRPNSGDFESQRHVSQVPVRIALLQTVPLLRFRRPFECTQPIQERISPKDAKNSCTFYEFRMTNRKDTAPTSYTHCRTLMVPRLPTGLHATPMPAKPLRTFSKSSHTP